MKLLILKTKILVNDRTKTNLSENSLTRETILSNHDSDNNSPDNQQIEQIVHNNPEQNVNQIINNEMVLPNSEEFVWLGPRFNRTINVDYRQSPISFGIYPEFGI